MTRSLRRLSDIAALLLAGCGAGEGGGEAGGIPDTLSAYGYFEGTLADLRPAAGVVPFEPASPLWSDGADKARHLVLPPGARVRVTADDDWTFPLGTVLIKTFSFPDDERRPEGGRRIVETRLLVLEAEGWEARVYLWDEDQTEARRIIAGKRLTLSRLDATGAQVSQTYLVPNTNQCGHCHERDDEMLPLGPVTRQMRRPVSRDGATVDQLAWLEAQGVLDEVPEAALARPALVDPASEAPVAARARAWLDANCAHCHRPGGEGGPSGLVLTAEETDPTRYGVCKSPVAAAGGTGGFDHDIEPGHPERSILVHRIRSTDPEIKMPEIPNLRVDEHGVALVERWIAEMQPPGCR